MSEGGTARRRILVIDDDEVMRELLAALLTVQGYEVLVASSGEDALRQLAEPDAPSLLLTDLQMPGLEGEALTSALRLAAPPAAVLIGMSGRQPDEAVLRPLNGFLPKPFDSRTLERTFAAALAAKDAQPATVLTEAAAPAPLAQAASESVSGEPPVLDEAIFSALGRSFKAPQLLELYGMTLDDVRLRYARMETHAAGSDLEAVQREAHAVKGACGMVGARELQQLATAVERGTTLNTSALVKFPEACDRLQRTLEAKLQQKW